MDNQAVARILKRLGQRADQHGIEALNPEQRLALRAWAALGIIGNGGFRYFYEGDQDPLDIATAFRELGFEPAARACEQSVAVFPGGRWPTDRNVRWNLLKKIDWDALKDLERDVYRIEWEELESAIGRYVAKHPDAFGIKLN